MGAPGKRVSYFFYRLCSDYICTHVRGDAAAQNTLNSCVNTAVICSVLMLPLVGVLCCRVSLQVGQKLSTLQPKLCIFRHRKIDQFLKPLLVSLLGTQICCQFNSSYNFVANVAQNYAKLRSTRKHWEPCRP